MAIVDRIYYAVTGGSKDELEIASPSTDRDFNDCTSCRVLGSTACTSLGFYTYYSGMKRLRENRQLIEKSKSKYKYGSRQLGILSLSTTLVGLGIYRMIN